MAKRRGSLSARIRKANREWHRRQVATRWSEIQRAARVQVLPSYGRGRGGWS